MTSVTEEFMEDGVVARPMPGPGVVARIGDVLFVAMASGQQTLGLQHLLAECGSAVSADGRRLVRQLAGWLSAADPDGVPSFALAVPSPQGLAVMLHGNGEAAVTSAGSATRLSGQDAATWVDRLVPWPVEEVVLSCGHLEDVAPEPWLDLRAGVVPGGGLVARWVRETSSNAPEKTLPPSAAAAPRERPEPVDPPAETVAAPPPPPAQPPAPELTMVRPAAPAFESVLLIDAAGDVEDAEATVEHAPEQLPENQDQEPAGILVKGINCKRGHFNDPAAAFCGVCGISMVQQTHQLVDGVRPPLGVVVLDDGATFRVDDDYVIGREPEHDPRVQEGSARPLVVADTEGTVSRSHALLTLVGWDVQLTDLGSSNGTYITTPNSSGSRALPRHQPVKIEPGTRIVMGSRTLVYDSHVKI